MGPKGAVEILFRKEINDSARSGQGDGREGRRVHARSSPTRTSPRGAATWTTSSIRATRARGSSTRSRRCAPSATGIRRRSTATFRCELFQDPHRQPRRDRAAHHSRVPRDGNRLGGRLQRRRRARAARPRGRRGGHIGAPPSARELPARRQIIEAARPHRRRGHSPRLRIPLRARVVCASACATRGSSFIGPPAEAIAAMGSKTAARQLAIERRGAGRAGHDGGARRRRRSARDRRRVRVPGAAQGGGGRRRKGNARRARRAAEMDSPRSIRRGARRRTPSATTRSTSRSTSSARDTSRSRCSATSTARCSRSTSASARCSAAIRR